MSRSASSSANPPLEGLISALRRPGHEPQLTQVLAAIAQADRAFAGSLAEVLVAACGQEACGRLGEIPSELDCKPEVRVKGGRVDLVFSSRDGGFGLLVELKIDATYGHEQLETYVLAANELGFATAAVLAVTKSPPWYGEDQVSADPRWLGSVRWTDVFDDLIRLQHAELAEEWRAFLRVVADQGDFGVVSFDPDAVRGWARYHEGAQLLYALMEEMATPALDLVRREVASAKAETPREQHAGLLKKKQSPVWLWNDRVHLHFAIPAEAAEERLRVQFYAYGGVTNFAVEARYPDARPLLEGPDRDEAVVESTAALGDLADPFGAGRDWENYWSRWHDICGLIDRGENPVEQLLEFVTVDVRDLAESGLFDALQAASEREARPPTPAHDE